MADVKKAYPVLSRVRHSGKVYLAGCDGGIKLTAKQAEALLKVKSIGPDAGDAYDPNAPLEPSGLGEFDLVKALGDLMAKDHDIKSMKMPEIAKLLGANARGVKRKDVTAALAEISAQDMGDT